MIKVLMAVLTVLVMASVAFAAYPVNHPCLVTQRLDPLKDVVTSVAPAQRVASLAGVVTSVDPVRCPASYFGNYTEQRRVVPESPDSGTSGGNS